MAGEHGFDVLALVELTAKADIVTEFAILDPVLTLNETSSASDCYWTLSSGEVLFEQGMLEGSQLVGLDLARLVSDEIDLVLRYVDHLTNHGVQETSLATSYLTDNDHKFSLSDLQIDVLDVEDVVKAARLEWDFKLSVGSLGQNLTDHFADSRLRLLDPLLFLLLDLLPDLVFLLFVHCRDAPTEATFHSEGIFGRNGVLA